MEVRLRARLLGPSRKGELACAIQEMGWAFDLPNTWMHSGGPPRPRWPERAATANHIGV